MESNTTATLDTLDVEGKVVLCRVDFNVPMQDGEITDDTRILAALPTIQNLRDRGAKLVLTSHLGRPKGRRNKDLSLLPVAARLAALIDAEVVFAHDTIGAGVEEIVKNQPQDGIIVLENLRFDAREKKGDPDFGVELSKLADVYVDDAFGAMHRKHASITVVPEHLPSAIGLLVEKEVNALSKLRNKPEHPFGVILGGAKVSDKIDLIESFARHADHIFIGGAMAYTLLASQGINVGASRVEQDKLSLATRLLSLCEEQGVTVHLPVDHVVASEFSQDAKPEAHAQIAEGLIGMDIGPQTISEWADVLNQCRTILWNGPLGVFEWESFSNGTHSIAKTLAAHDGFTVIGGGDSAAAVAKFKLSDQLTHISTGGGACLEYLTFGELSGLTAIRENS